MNWKDWLLYFGLITITVIVFHLISWLTGGRLSFADVGVCVFIAHWLGRYFT